ncbi:putative porin [Echinicola marina]|uniref:putative porin n=1 Tax=Echinicola marina TaxID=2859768 RepID=UPI001CF62AFE|nr:putative porin [Echinicola marina]UCS95644.1 putative porin [Echinicola marina]
MLVSSMTTFGQTSRGQEATGEGKQEDQQQRRGGLIDDSTKMVYGPKTSLYFLEKNVRFNKMEKTPLDTGLTNFHNFEPVFKSGNRYQDLGNLGSAAKPVYYDLPGKIGTTSGFGVYDLYYKSPDSLKYFDTKSPYTKLEAFYGGGNRNMLNVEFARNITPTWNVGFNFNTIRARKTLNPNARDDNMAEQTSYSIHTNYQSDNGKYRLLANFSRMHHKVFEQGGIISPEVDSTSLYFTYEDSKVWLSNSEAVDLRQDYHLYQQFEILKGWQIYHVTDWRKQGVSFVSDLTTSDSVFFNQFNQNRFINQDTTQNYHRFVEFNNEAGFKGDFGPVYYNAYVKYRSGSLGSPYFERDNNFNEFYVGGALRGDINEKWSFEAEGEYLVPEGYRLRGYFISPYLDVTYTKASYKPTAMQQMYRGNHYRWTNDFSNTGVDQIKGEIKADFAKLSVRPSLTLNRVNKYVYFNQSQEAEQIDGEAYMVVPGIETSFRFWKKLVWQSEVIYTSISGDAADKFRIPEWYIRTRLFFDGPMFDENLFIQFGLEGRYKSDYYAEAYMPATQQFYLQDDFLIEAYPVVDAFVNLRINRTRVLFRYNHVNSNLLNVPGYFVTPDFTGLKGSLDLGISWYFFD